jgi:phytanoyl-CoA hydroxylase
MTPPSHNEIRICDASRRPSIDGADAEALVADGLLIVRGVLDGVELAELRADTERLIEGARRDPVDGTDVHHRLNGLTGRIVPFRIEYVVDKVPSVARLLAHPFLLDTVERLQGPDFINTWDSLVFKEEDSGVEIFWHRDDPNPIPFRGVDCLVPAFNADIYLDSTDASSQLWGLPGSHRWELDRVEREITKRTERGFCTRAAAPLGLEAGDMLLHDVGVLHGSAENRSRLRRVVYFEFKPRAYELESGPHRREYLPLKQQVLEHCIALRAAHLPAEQPYSYRPGGLPNERSTPLSTLRFPHGDYSAINT